MRGPVADGEREARVVEGVAANRRQVCAARRDHLGVDLDHRHLFDGAVLENLLDGAAVAAADHQHPPRGAVSQEGHVYEHLVVDELVALGGLHDIVEHQGAAERRGLENRQALMAGVTFAKHRIGAQAEGVAVVELLVEPARHIPSPRRWVSTRVSPGVNAASRTASASPGSAAPHMKRSKAA